MVIAYVPNEPEKSLTVAVRHRAYSSSCTVQDTAHVVDGGQVGQEGYQIGQLGIVGVVEPGRDGDGVIGVEDVRCRRIIEDDGICNGPAELR